MMRFDPHENPLRPGNFDLNKQLRIAARNRRISKNLIERAERRQLNMIGAASVGVIIIFSAVIWAVFGLVK